jgi:hypothetical protein
VTTPPEPQTTATFVGNTIVPVTNFGVSIEKETVTVSVTVTETVRVPEASAI